MSRNGETTNEAENILAHPMEMACITKLCAVSKSSVVFSIRERFAHQTCRVDTRGYV